MTVPVRLAKYLASSLPCSRREAELYIEGGWVSVEGLVVEEPQFMVSQQQVTLHPDAQLTPVAPVTLLFNQPFDYTPADTAPLTNPVQINAAMQSPDDCSGIHLLKRHFVKLTPCTPLERNTGGLRVFTQDWRVERKLKEDAQTMEQEYVAEVAGELSPEGLKLLNHGLKFNGKPLAPCKVSWQNETRLRFALKGVMPGQIAHACQAVGLQVLSLKRLRIGRISMGKLQPGQWRYLMPHERF
ncbi:MAG: RNA-binding protein [Gallionellales bacterium CG_4_10_14_3_um_filter_54_96]|nr:MAG: RNA-binding protein [Gallionellales bacterium CG_4_10_14_3_um_filter_54_96]